MHGWATVKANSGCATQRQGGKKKSPEIINHSANQAATIVQIHNRVVLGVISERTKVAAAAGDTFSQFSSPNRSETITIGSVEITEGDRQVKPSVPDKPPRI